MSWWRRAPAPSGEPAPDAGGPVIRLQGISRVFKGDADEETWALRDVNLEVSAGEYISVSGPSGCGKSTLLSVLALLDTPTSGSYWLKGKPVSRMSPAERARARSLDAGLIFQSFNLTGHMTVYEHV